MKAEFEIKFLSYSDRCITTTLFVCEVLCELLVISISKKSFLLSDAIQFRNRSTRKSIFCN